MGICKKSNLTIIIKIAENIKGIVDIENNFVTGSIGKDVDRMLDQPPNRQCKLIGAYSFGTELSNHSFNGALGLMKEKIGDLYLSPSTQLFVKEFLLPSQAVYADKHVISHAIRDSVIKEVDIINLIGLSTQLKCFFVFTSLIFVLSLFILNGYICPNSNFRINFKLIILNFFKWKLTFKHPISKIGLILVFYNIFFMLFKHIIANSIKTSRIVCQTNDLISSIEDLFAKDTVVCWLKDDIEISLAVQSPKNSAIRRLYEEKKFKKLTKNMNGQMSYDCLLDFNLGNSIDLDNKVLFIDKATHYTFLAYFINYQPGTKLFINDDSFMESVTVYHYRRGLKRFQRKIIDTHNIDRLESGIALWDYNRIIANQKKLVDVNAKIYTTIQSYVDDHTLFNDLDLDYFRTLFYAKACVEFGLLFVFSVHYLNKTINFQKLIYKAHKRMRIILSKLFDYFSALY